MGLTLSELDSAPVSWQDVGRAAQLSHPLKGAAAAKRSMHHGRHLLGAGRPDTVVMGRQSLRLSVTCAVPCAVKCIVRVHVRNNPHKAKATTSGYSGVLRSIPEYSGIPRHTPGYPRGSPEYSGKLRSTPEYSGIPPG
jgi:hypothetical protein